MIVSAFTSTNCPLIPVNRAGAASRYRNVILQRYAKTSQLHMPWSSNVSTCKLTATSMLSGHNISGMPHHQLHSWSSRGTLLLSLSASSTSFLKGDHGCISHTIPLLPKRRRPSKQARAFRDDTFKLPYPIITKKPEWWWRTLSCVPYLVALQMSNTAYYLLPLLEHYDFDNLIFYIPGAVQKLPFWFPMVYFNLAYFGVVRNKELPHFVRFHVMMGMLLETGLDVVWYASNFMPLVHYQGTYAMQYWAIVGFAYIWVLLECIRCAVSGSYAKIPFFSANALIHTLFSIGRYYRPF